MDVDLDSMEPPYQQIARQLRARILSGEYPPGTLIPSKSRLHQETGISVKTITKAVEVLRAEGLVTTVRGMGTYATKPEDRG
jgi:GntR family transcriptional regulator